MVLDRRPLDLEIEHKRKGGWNTQGDFQHPIKLNPSLFNLQIKFYFEII
jgi:hypothetical protein